MLPVLVTRKPQRLAWNQAEKQREESGDSSWLREEETAQTERKSKVEDERLALEEQKKRREVGRIGANSWRQDTGEGQSKGSIPALPLAPL